MVTFDWLLEVYLQQIKNIDAPDDLMTETLLVLSTRDEFEKLALTEDESVRLNEADDELLLRWEALAKALPFSGDQPREYWWWYLDEGPQVREEAKALARVG